MLLCYSLHSYFCCTCYNLQQLVSEMPQTHKLPCNIFLAKLLINHYIVIMFVWLNTPGRATSRQKAIAIHYQLIKLIMFPQRVKRKICYDRVVYKSIWVNPFLGSHEWVNWIMVHCKYIYIDGQPQFYFSSLSSQKNLTWKYLLELLCYTRSKYIKPKKIPNTVYYRYMDSFSHLISNLWSFHEINTHHYREA